MVGRTSGPGGPGNPIGPMSPTFPCRNQKQTQREVNLWLLAFLCLEEHSSVQLGAGPLERDTGEQRTFGYLPQGLVSLVPQGPQANHGYPEIERQRIFQKTQRSTRKYQFSHLWSCSIIFIITYFYYIFFKLRVTTKFMSCSRVLQMRAI